MKINPFERDDPISKLMQDKQQQIQPLTFQKSDESITLEDQIKKVDTKELLINEDMKQRLINNASVFPLSTNYEQTLPSLVDYTDAFDLHSYPFRTLVFHYNQENYETLPDLHICFRCGHIDQYAVSNSPCKNCKREGLIKITPSSTPEPWLPYPAPRKIDSWIDIYQQIVELLQKTLYYDEKILYDIHALWIMASYRQQDFITAPYLQFIAPISSGKTRALEITSTLAYRGVLYATISPAALCREIDKYKITPCVDQAEFNFDTTTESGRENYSIWMCGYRRGQFYTRASQSNETDVIRKDVFGFKALAATISFDEALSSRSIVFNMKEGTPEIKNMKEIMPEIQRLRCQLLYFHLCNPSPLSPHLDAVKELGIDGRLEEIYQPLISIAGFLSLDINQIKAFILADRLKKLRELQESLEGQIVFTIKQFIDEAQGIVNSSGELVGIRLKDIAEEIDVKPVSVGRKLNVLNLEKTKTRDGIIIRLDSEKNQKQLVYLYKKYGLAGNLTLDNKIYGEVGNNGA